MSGLTTRLPHLGFPLLLSTVMSTTVVILHFTTQPISPGSFIPALVAVNSAYYLVRYFKRLADINRDALAGGDAWPATPLFPAETEHSN